MSRESSEVAEGIERLERTTRNLCETQEETNRQLKDLNVNLVKFMADAEVIIASVQGMGGASALTLALAPVKNLLHTLGLGGKR